MERPNPERRLYPNQLALFSETAHKDVLISLGQRALFHGKLGWHNNPVDYVEPAKRQELQLKEPVEDGWELVDGQ